MSALENPSTRPASAAPDRWNRAWSWLAAHQRLVLGAAVAFQLLVLAGMILLKTSVLITGDTVLLRVQPVDPRDLFRGEYVILGYSFSVVPPSKVAGLQVPPEGSNGLTVYAILEPEDDRGHWQATRFSATPPQGVKFIKGRYGPWDRVSYGIESFFVQQGRGRGYEQAVRDRRLVAKVALGKNGQAVLRELIIE